MYNNIGRVVVQVINYSVNSMINQMDHQDKNGIHFIEIKQIYFLSNYIKENKK